LDSLSDFRTTHAAVLVIYLFFLYSALPHRTLPSFPTRRSSDLKGVRSQPNLEIAGQRGVVRSETMLIGVGDRCRCQWWSDIDHRSEEHTSELQSLRHLVCRLLLEKKKKKNKANLTNQNKQSQIT